MWKLDSETFGRPQVGLQQQHEQHFIRDRSDVGPSSFKLYDPTSPNLVALDWVWSDQTYQEFRAAWKDPTRLAWGANWFLCDLALGTGTDQWHITPNTNVEYKVHFVEGYSAAIFGHGYRRVSGSLEVGAATGGGPSFGEVPPSGILSTWVSIFDKEQYWGDV